jgi:hypothetical protein
LLIASTALKAADPKETTSPPSTPTIPSAATAAKGDSAASPWPGGSVDQWHGFVRHRFAVDGATAWVVEPHQAAPGKPWSWCLEFPDAFTDRTGVLQLLEHGFHHVHLEVGNTFGSPRALEQFEAFYQVLQRGGLGPKAALVGISRGGLYAYRWAAKNPERVACIYGDAPVCDFKSWPGGKGTGKGSAGDWTQLQRYYGFATEAEALAFTGNPVDRLAPLAKAKVGLIHVVGDTDDVVPVAGTIAAAPAGGLLGASAADAWPTGTAATARAVTPSRAAERRRRPPRRVAGRSWIPCCTVNASRRSRGRCRTCPVA